MFWRAVLDRLDAGMPVFIALVVANTRGSPGTVGARLLVDGAGAVEGTIGGGIMEARLLAAARKGLQAGQDAPPALLRLEHRNKPDTAHPSGLICAGEQTNLHCWLQPARDARAIRAFCAALSSDGDGTATLLIDASGLRVTADSVAGGLMLQADGERWRYRESSIHPDRVVIVGGGHCGKALARLADAVGYVVDVFDTRPEAFADTAAWPMDVRRYRLDDYAELSQRVRWPALATVAVMTTAMREDVVALSNLAELPLRWLGVMGSVAKIHEIRRQLAARGIAQERIDAIHGPIGLPMKSDTPAEIAVSIMAAWLTARMAVR
ncbi:MAG TPA: XdhC family protein [Rhodanobacteraceae bacterium]|nr:XdhC family protein [Rhodanobacteraceae bacterium]